MSVPFKLNDGGRIAAGFDEVRDCGVRALAVCRGIPYKEAHQLLKSLGRKDRCGTKYKLFATNLAALGLKNRPDLSCQTLGKGIAQMQQGRFFVRTGGHFFAVVDGVVHDLCEQKPTRRLVQVYQAF